MVCSRYEVTCYLRDGAVTRQLSPSGFFGSRKPRVETLISEGPAKGACGCSGGASAFDLRNRFFVRSVPKVAGRFFTISEVANISLVV